MLGRDLRSTLDYINPPRSSCQERSTDAQEKNKKCRSFNVGQSVLVKYYKNRNPYWEKGIVQSRIGQRMYTVKIRSLNIICKRHIDQIQPDKHIKDDMVIYTKAVATTSRTCGSSVPNFT